MQKANHKTVIKLSRQLARTKHAINHLKRKMAQIDRYSKRIARLIASGLLK